MVLIRCWCTVIIKLIMLEAKETIKGNKVDGANKVLVHCNNKTYKVRGERNKKLIKSVVVVRCWFTVIIKLIRLEAKETIKVY